MFFNQLCKWADFFVFSRLLFAKNLTNNILGTKVVHLEFHCISIINLWKLRRAKNGINQSIHTERVNGNFKIRQKQSLRIATA